MNEQLEKMVARYQELEQLLASHELIADRQQYNKLAKELSDLKSAVVLYRELKNLLKESQDLEEVLLQKHDEDYHELVQQEIKDLDTRKADIELKLKKMLTGEDKDAGRACIIEIRQGTGGDEAGLFAADLYRMYS
ncbi:MAG: PCRF domain-containing protein, partial [Candidatus Omnitrophota bacterium]